MRSFNAASVGSSLPYALGISDYFLFHRVIFSHTDSTGLFIAFTGFPVKGNDIFSAVLIVEN